MIPRRWKLELSRLRLWLLAPPPPTPCIFILSLQRKINLFLIQTMQLPYLALLLHLIDNFIRVLGPLFNTPLVALNELLWRAFPFPDQVVDDP